MLRRARIRRRSAACAATAVAVLALAPMPAASAPSSSRAAPVRTVGAAASTTVGIGRNAMITGFSASRYALRRGGTLRVANHDTVTHTVTAVGRTRGGQALFDTVVRPGATATVNGVAALPSGRYAFYCRVHPSMRATLVIGSGRGRSRPSKTTFEQPLTFPRVITAARSSITIKKGRQRILPHGAKTPIRAYGGTYPGPTIRRRAGRATSIRFTDRLGRRAGAFSVHLHGDHHRSRADGQPTRYLLRHGKSRTYRYPLRSGGRPVPPSFGFYHDHVMGATGRNNWLGMQGMFIVDDGREKSLGLPTGRYDRPLLVADRSFRRDHTLTPVRTSMAGMPMTGSSAPPNDATVGTRVLVNGRYAPYLRVATHRYRLRLLNGSNFTSYDFALSGGRAFTQIGTGSSLLPAPVRRSHILLGPAQRADVIVDFRGQFGKRIVLRSVARRHRPRAGIGTPSVDILQFRVTRRVTDRARLHRRLEATPRIHVPARSTMTWNFGLGHAASGGTYWTVNGRPFDPKRIDARVPLGATRRWTLHNSSTMTHYIHLHEEQWHTVSRDGKAPPAWERGLQDTWRLDPGETVVVAAKFVDYTGVFMIHCHMLDHEDDGMMAQFAVVRRHSSALPAGYTLASTRTTAMPADPSMTGSDMTGRHMTGSDMRDMPGMPGMAPHDRAGSTDPQPTSTLADAGIAAAALSLLFLLVTAAASWRRSSRRGGSRAATRTAPTAG